MYYLCRRKAALGNLKASFHCARLHFLCRRKDASQQNIQASLIFCIRFAFSLHRQPMKVLRKPRRRHLLRPRAVTIDDRRRSSIKTQKVALSGSWQSHASTRQRRKGKTPQPAELAQFLLLHEHEVDGGNEAEEGCKVVPVQTLTLEENVGNDGEDDEGYAFLYHLELNQ